MNKKTVCVTGISGQLGQFLAKYLLENEPNLQIIGTIRHKSYDEQPYIFDKSKIIFELMDLSDVHSIENIIVKYKFDYFINTAANAFVGESWKLAAQHLEYNTLAVLHQLESIRKHSPHTRYFNMGTSEEFAVCANNGPQNEDTKISPRSPYGCSKAASRYLINVFKNSYNLFAIQGWTFNFESELRGEKYVTRKITKGVARIYHALKNNQKFEPIELGNLDSYRSWQFAGDVADGIWRMLNPELYNPNLGSLFDLKQDQQNIIPYIQEYVLSAPDTHSIREFVEKSFESAGFQGKWLKGNKAEDEIFYLDLQCSIGRVRYDVVKINPQYYRPLDVAFLYGDASRIKKDLGWQPKVSFNELVERMTKYDIENFKL